MNNQQTLILLEERTPPLAVAEQRVLLHGIHWQTYEDLLSQNEGNNGSRVTHS